MVKTFIGMKYNMLNDKTGTFVMLGMNNRSKD